MKQYYEVEAGLMNNSLLNKKLDWWKKSWLC